MNKYNGKQLEEIRDKETLSETIAHILSLSKPKYPTRAGLLGKRVRSKDGESEGTIVYSTFGISISGISSKESVEGITEDTHWQTLGDDPEVVMQHWEVIDDEQD